MSKFDLQPPTWEKEGERERGGERGRKRERERGRERGSEGGREGERDGDGGSEAERNYWEWEPLETEAQCQSSSLVAFKWDESAVGFPSSVLVLNQIHGRFTCEMRGECTTTPWSNPAPMLETCNGPSIGCTRWRSWASSRTSRASVSWWRQIDESKFKAPFSIGQWSWVPMGGRIDFR